MYCHFADLCKMEGTVAEFATVASDMSTIFATSREWLFFLWDALLLLFCFPIFRRPAKWGVKEKGP